MEDATKGKKSVWRSREFSENLNDKFVLSPQGKKARVIGFCPRTCQYDVLFDDGHVEYLLAYQLLGWSICETQERRDAIFERLCAVEVQA